MDISEDVTTISPQKKDLAYEALALPSIVFRIMNITIPVILQRKVKVIAKSKDV
jgi:hypothetical protein